MKIRDRILSFVALGALLGLPACEDSQSTGTVNVRVWGEGNIEQGVPAADVQDGWQVDFTRFETEFRDLKVAGVPVALSSPVVDATIKSASDVLGQRGQPIGVIQIPEGRYQNAEFTLVRTTIEGRATKAGKTLTFAWTFDKPVRYTQCEAETKVKADQPTTFEITLHADHYLYDTLTGNHEAKLVFDAIAAADRNGDGVIAQEELAVAPIADTFDIGSQPIPNMWAWLVAQHMTLAHTDGEAHCKGQAL